MADFGSSPLQFENFDTQSVELFGAEFATFNYVPNAGAQPGGQDGLTDPKGLLLMRAVAGVTLIPWTPLKTSLPIAVLGSDAIHPSGGAVPIEIRAIRKGDIALNLLNYFNVLTGTYPLLSTLTGVDPIPTPEEAVDLLARSLMFARFVQPELTRFDNTT
jgi:hypothetical protein